MRIDIPTNRIVKRLLEIVEAITKGDSGKSLLRECTMNIPPKIDHDADYILTEAATIINLIGFLEENTIDLRCIDEPCQDDFDISWIVVEHYMDKPQEREIARASTPIAALKDAKSYILSMRKKAADQKVVKETL